jgi:hypothetical protein
MGHLALDPEALFRAVLAADVGDTGVDPNGELRLRHRGRIVQLGYRSTIVLTNVELWLQFV